MTVTVREELREIAARAVSPYAFDDSYWAPRQFQNQAPRNQLLAQANAFHAVDAVLTVFSGKIHD